MAGDKSVRRFSDGDVRLWIEQESSIHLRAISGTDPVELSSAEARDVAKALLDLASELDELNKT
jgi:hypothetical protein